MIAALFWSLLALNLLLRLNAFRFLKPEEGPLSGGLPAVDVIVPARNEEAVFEASLQSILGQEYPKLRVVVVDDQSTDATLSIMRRMANDDPRLTVVEGKERPTGWVGKTWAVHQGFRETTAEWLCFVDADMELDRRAIATAVQAAERESASLVSLMPRIDCQTFWQSSIALSFLQVLAHLYPLDRVNNPRVPTAMAAGGFILVRRSAYEASGGHEVGRNDIVDDVLLARRVKSAGGRLHVRLGPDLATTHMYGSFWDIWRGLRKNAYAGMDYQFYKYAFGMLGALYLAWAPIAGTVFGVATRSVPEIAFGLWGIAAQGLAAYPMTVFLRISPLYCLTLPTGITAYVAIATSSVWHYYRGNIHWKGRALSVTEVRAADPRPKV